MFSLQVTWGQIVTASLPSGFYEAGTMLSLYTDLPGEVRFTFDGTEPDASSQLYSTPLALEDDTSRPNTISEIPTNSPTTYAHLQWQPPVGPVPKANLLKAALFENGVRISEVFTWEYFVGTPTEIDLPIFSIWADSMDFFDYEKGIYVPGIHYDNNPGIWQPGNYFKKGDEWEHVVSVGFYENQMPVFRQQVELQLHGSGSREYPAKSIRLSAKSSLGTSYFEHDFFADRPWEKYKRLILRNSGQDFIRTLFADALMHDLLGTANIETQASRPVVVFLNGRYWGIHNLRERYDKYYFEHYHSSDRDELDHVELVDIYEGGETGGEGIDFENLHAELPFLDMDRAEDFQFIAEQIDLHNYIEQHIAKIYGACYDWPGNNVEIWRSREPGSKWRWVASDFDDAFQQTEMDSYGHATKEDGSAWPNPEWSTRLFRKLMEHPDFRRQYKSRLRYHLDHTFHPGRVKRAIDSLAALYRPEIKRHTDRWRYPSSVDKWEYYIQSLKSFADKRALLVWQNFEEYYPDTYFNPVGFELGPNPATNFLKVELPVDWPNGLQYSIFRTSGQLVQTGELQNNGLNILTLNNFTSEIYIFSVEGFVTMTISVNEPSN